MKKALSLILVLVMLCSCMSLFATAEDDVVAINIEEMPGYEETKSYIGATGTTVAPLQDGNIGIDEYQYSVDRYPVTIDKPVVEGYSQPATEYFSYDDEYIYYAVTHPQWFSAGASIDIRLVPDFVIDATPLVQANNRSIEDKNAIQIAFSTTGWSASAIPEGKAAPAEDELVHFFRHDGGYQTGVLEFKISRAYLATQMGLDSAADVKKFTYSTYTTDIKTGGTPEWVYSNMDLLLSEEQCAWLVEQGVETPVGRENSKLNRVCYMAVLDEAPKATITAEDIVTREEASIRISATNPGLRFKTDVNTAALNALVEEYGAENVKVGTLIALDAQDLTLTHETASKLDVEATIGSPFATEGENTVFAGSVSNVKEANLEKKFAARGYVAYNDGTAWIYVYSNVTAVRDIVTVVNAALADEEAGYTQAQIDVLNAIIAPLN